MPDPIPERGKAPAPCVTKLVNWIDEQLNGPGHETGHQSWLSDIADTLERQSAEIEALRDRFALAEALLKRVVISGGCGSWSARSMLDWCCDYKDFTNGCGAEWCERKHDHCSHRERPDSTDDEPPCFDPRCRSQIEALTALVRGAKWPNSNYGTPVLPECPWCGSLWAEGHRASCKAATYLRARLAATGESDD